MIDEKKVSQVKDEWKLYQAEDDHKFLGNQIKELITAGVKCLK